MAYPALHCKAEITDFTDNTVRTFLSEILSQRLLIYGSRFNLTLRFISHAERQHKDVHRHKIKITSLLKINSLFSTPVSVWFVDNFTTHLSAGDVTDSTKETRIYFVVNFMTMSAPEAAQCRLGDGKPRLAKHVEWGGRHVNKTQSRHSRRQTEENLKSSSLNSWCRAQIRSRIFPKRGQKCFRLNQITKQWEQTDQGRENQMEAAMTYFAVAELRKVMTRPIGWLWRFYWTLEHQKYKIKVNLPLSDVMYAYSV
jgi:hypothetical protein